MRIGGLALVLFLPTAALAVGLETDTPPTPTETTTECTDGQIWDAESGTCVAPQDSRLDDDTRFGAVREFAYAGRYGDALAVLAAMQDQDADRVLTYQGFVHRRMGHRALGMAYYLQALAVNPDNLLARSYMGQALVEAGDIAGARLQLAEIRARGGRQTWPEVALRTAIGTGAGFRY